MLKLIDEADKVPVLISAISQSGFVIMEVSDFPVRIFIMIISTISFPKEFTDAERSLDMKNSKRNLKRIYSRPMMGRYVDLSIFEDDEADHPQTANGKISKDDTKAADPITSCSEDKQEIVCVGAENLVLNEAEEKKIEQNLIHEDDDSSLSLLGKRSLDDEKEVVLDHVN